MYSSIVCLFQFEFWNFEIWKFEISIWINIYKWILLYCKLCTNIYLLVNTFMVLYTCQLEPRCRAANQQTFIMYQVSCNQSTDVHHALDFYFHSWTSRGLLFIMRLATMQSITSIELIGFLSINIMGVNTCYSSFQITFSYS